MDMWLGRQTDRQTERQMNDGKTGREMGIKTFIQTTDKIGYYKYRTY
jgi:hypothetical protein